MADSPLSPLIEKWKAEQNEMRRRLIVRPLEPLPRFVAGADMAYTADKKTALAAAVVYDRIEQRLIEVVHATRPVEFPYIPTFLSFREGPAVVQAIRSLKHEFGVVCFDGQGYAHPRRFGLACHAGLLLGVPTVGCAKTILVGTHGPLGTERGAMAPLVHRGETVGMAVRLRDAVTPVYVSAGHLMDLETALRVVLSMATGFREPETTRRAHRLVNAERKRSGSAG